jgi:hypothetical protein
MQKIQQYFFVCNNIIYFRPFNFSYWRCIIDYNTVLLWYCDTVLPFYCNAVLLCYHSAVELCFCTTVLVWDLVSILDLYKANHYYYPKCKKSSNIILSVIISYTSDQSNFSTGTLSLTLLPFYCDTVILCYHSTVVLCYCSFVLPFYCITVLIWYCAIILQ